MQEIDSERFDLRVESRFKNARLYNALHERFSALAEQSRKGYGQGALPILRTASTVIGVPPGTLSRLLSLSESPVFKKTGEYRPVALLIADALDMEPAELFPSSLYALKLPRIVVREFSSPQVISLQEAAHLHLLLPAPDADELRHLVNNKEIAKALATLTPREEKIIRLRFGIGCEYAHSLHEIAAEFGVTRERIRQIETHALRRLRNPSRSMALRELLRGSNV